MNDIVRAFRQLDLKLRKIQGVEVKSRVGRPASTAALAKYDGILHPDVLALAQKANGFSIQWNFANQPGDLGGAFRLPTLQQFIDLQKQDGQQGYEFDEGVPQKLDALSTHDVPAFFGDDDELHIFDLDDSMQPCTVATAEEVVRFGIDCLFVKGWGSLLNAAVEMDPEVLARVRDAATRLVLPIPAFAVSG